MCGPLTFYMVSKDVKKNCIFFSGKGWNKTRLGTWYHVRGKGWYLSTETCFLCIVWMLFLSFSFLLNANPCLNKYLRLECVWFPLILRRSFVFLLCIWIHNLCVFVNCWAGSTNVTKVLNCAQKELILRTRTYLQGTSQVVWPKDQEIAPTPGVS